MELVKSGSGVWHLTGRADRHSVDNFFRSLGKDFYTNSDSIKIVIDDLDIADSTVLALLIHWRLDVATSIDIEVNNPALLNLIKVHRIEHLFVQPRNK